MAPLPTASTELRVSTRPGGGGPSEFGAWEESAKNVYWPHVFFGWQRQAVNVKKVVWQVANAPFDQPKSGLDWKGPKGLVMSGTIKKSQIPATVAQFNSSNEKGMFEIDFSSFPVPPSGTVYKYYVRVIPLAGGFMTGLPSNTVTIEHGAQPAPNVIVKVVPAPIVEPFHASVKVVGYKPPGFRSDPYAFILTKPVPGFREKKIFAKAGANNPGDHFHMDPQEYKNHANALSLWEQVGSGAEALLEGIKSAWNKFQSAYYFVENQLVSAIASLGVVDEATAKKMIDYYLAIYGYTPSRGTFDQELSDGRDALKAFVAANSDEEEEKNPSGGDNAETKKKKRAELFAKIDQYTDEVRHLANGGDDPNNFSRLDPEQQPYPATLTLEVSYRAGNSAQTSGGGRKVKISVQSQSYDDPQSPGLKVNQLNPPYIFQKEVDLPDAEAGTTFKVPVNLDFDPLYEKDPSLWYSGFNAPVAIFNVDGETFKRSPSKKMP